MASKIRRILRGMAGNVWFFVCLIAAGFCAALSVQLLFRLPPLDDAALPHRIILGIPVLFGALAGLYGMISAALSGLKDVRLARHRHDLTLAHRRIQELESLRMEQRERIEQLSMLREVATAVNQESDFAIIAEKVLELIRGLLEPLEVTIFLIGDESGTLQPFAHSEGDKITVGKQVPACTIPDFELSAFRKHSMVCRLHGDELQAIVPLKLDDKILGVLLLIFSGDDRPAEQQHAEFNRNHRRALLEIGHHISLALKTKYFQTRAVRDSLTGLYSRSHFNSQLRASADFARRNEEPFSLLLVDIDHFKKVNDRHGHATGDMVLARVAGRIQKVLRKYDSAYRYGGEEMAVLLPRTTLKQASEIGERIRKTIEQRKFRGTKGQLLHVTVSVGAGEFNYEGDDADALFERADKNLYTAKENGRNQIVPPPPD